MEREDAMEHSGGRKLLLKTKCLLTENNSGDEVISTSFCLASLSACRDFIKSSLRIKASLFLKPLKSQTVKCG